MFDDDEEVEVVEEEKVDPFEDMVEEKVEVNVTELAVEEVKVEAEVEEKEVNLFEKFASYILPGMRLFVSDEVKGELPKCVKKCWHVRGKMRFLGSRKHDDNYGMVCIAYDKDRNIFFLASSKITFGSAVEVKQSEEIDQWFNSTYK